MSILIAIRRRWDDSMWQCAVLYRPKNVHECWYRFFLTIVAPHTERRCCCSSIKHISKRFFVLRHILDTRRKNVNTVNDSTVRQCHMDHRKSWVKRQSWGWRAFTRRILNDGCSPAYQMDVEISHIVIETCRDLTYTTKNNEYINRDSTSMRWLNVVVCGVARIK